MMSEREQPKACKIEIIERVPADQLDSGHPIVPNEEAK